MELELYSALQEAGVSEARARAVVESVNKAIDSRYSLHAQQLATRGDLAEMETRIIKWNIGAIMASVGIFATVMKMLG
ncbi:MAG: hypothetical protein LBQ81_00170 [Zoogloeaceae bacterium]|jgi:hypothetical protein|nr:hypothetical protein [Zoogloeaceae bacterium]